METLLNKTYKILNQKSEQQKLNDFHLTKPERPTKDVYFNPFNIPESRQKSKTKEYLSKVLAFIDLKKRSRFSDGITIMPIATTSKRLSTIWGSQQNISNAIKYMIKIGLLAEYDATYQFNAYYDKDNKCKMYAYSYDAEQSIKSYCQINNINKYIINNSITTIVQNFVDIKSFDLNEVRFSSKLHLMKPDNYSVADFESYLTYCLMVNYPQLEVYQALADKINATFYADDFDRQIVFKPTFTWSKGNIAVTKIGIRATNTLVSAKKDIDDDDRENQLYKEDVLNRYNLTNHYDVTSSVPRITYLLNNGVWLDEDIDLYKSMYESFIKLCPSETMEWNKETRSIFKSFHMNAYFDKETKIAAHLKRRIAMKTSYNKNEWDGLDFVMRSYRNAVEQTIGTLKYDSEVFFHESCIYMDVLYHILSSGVDCWQCYDEWNTNKSIDDIQSIVKSYCNKYYNTYIKQIKSNNTTIVQNFVDNNKINQQTQSKPNKYTTIVQNFAVDVKSLAEQALEIY